MNGKMKGGCKWGWSLTEMVSSICAVMLWVAWLSPARAWQTINQDTAVNAAFVTQQRLDVRGAFQILGTNVTASAEEINAAANRSARLTTASLTNGAALTLSASTPIVVLKGVGSANGSTNTVTLATPYPVGVAFLLTLDSASTNKLLLAENSPTLTLGADVVLSATDALQLFTTATNKAVRVSGGTASTNTFTMGVAVTLVTATNIYLDATTNIATNIFTYVGAVSPTNTSKVFIKP